MLRYVGFVAALFFVVVVFVFPQEVQNKKAAFLNTCTVEVNVGTAIDVACVIPAAVGNNFKVLLWAKYGDENSTGGQPGHTWDWYQCAVGGTGHCQNIPVAWTPYAVVQEQGPGGVPVEAVQVRIVPDNPGIAMRGRLQVSY